MALAFLCLGVKRSEGYARVLHMKRVLHTFPLALFETLEDAGTRAVTLILATPALWQHRTALYSNLFWLRPAEKLKSFQCSQKQDMSNCKINKTVPVPRKSLCRLLACSEIKHYSIYILRAQ